MGTTAGDVGLEQTAADAVKKRPHFRGTDAEHLILKQNHRFQVSHQLTVTFTIILKHFITISD